MSNQPDMQKVGRKATKAEREKYGVVFGQNVRIDPMTNKPIERGHGAEYHDHFVKKDAEARRAREAQLREDEQQ